MNRERTLHIRLDDTEAETFDAVMARVQAIDHRRTLSDLVRGFIARLNTTEDEDEFRLLASLPQRSRMPPPSRRR